MTPILRRLLTVWQGSSPAGAAGRMPWWILCATLALSSGRSLAADIRYDRDVRPILAEHCLGCHGPDAPARQADLRLDTEDGAKPRVIVPHRPDESEFIRRLLASDPAERMPPPDTGRELTATEIDTLRRWVEAGAPYEKHWAFSPIKRPVVPSPVGPASTDIDRFLVAAREARGVGTVATISRRELIRRATYDLTGLPPNWEEVAAFEADSSPQAFATVVDRLLASPRYGERWGRHWLDIARYADTHGGSAIGFTKFPFSYTYRDYVVQSFNGDVPWNRFVAEQVAADQMGLAETDPALAALGFLTIGMQFRNRNDLVDDQIDVVSRGLMGLTIACARCHDHKYDPIGTEDYYALYGIFAATERPYVLPLIEDPASVPDGVAFEARMGKARDELEQHIDAEFVKQTELFHRRFDAYLVRAATTPPDLWETAQFGLSLILEDFRPALMRRTRQLLAQRVRPEDRIFGPWARLMALSEADFASGAEEVLRASGAGANSLVWAALRGAHLTNRTNVPAVYGRLLSQLDYARPGAGSLPTNAPPAVLPADILAASAPADRAELLALFADAGSPLSFPRRETPDHMSRPDKDRYGGLVLALDKMAAHATNRPPARAMVVTDLPDPPPALIFVRGSPSRPGDRVSRALPRVLTGGVVQPFRQGSGRLELAQGIASPTNPLTARVLMNRVWMHHFGEPLVTSPADFGARSEAPVQAELLDWLAAEFLHGGSRLKPMHRLLVLSAAYRQGNANPAARARDPENRGLGWFPRRRLELEAMRDSLLVIAGRLDPTVGGRPIENPAGPANQRRTIYSVIDRQNLPALFRSFDFAAPDQCAERRPQTMVPQQALYALNSPFVLEQAGALAGLLASASPDPAERVRGLFQRALGRNPTHTEAAAALEFVKALKLPASSDGAPPKPVDAADAWAQLAQVLLISNEAVFID